MQGGLSEQSLLASVSLPMAEFLPLLCDHPCDIELDPWGAGTELQLHEPTVQRMQEHYSKRGVELNEARLRMATLPAGAEVMPPASYCLPVRPGR